MIDKYVYTIDEEHWNSDEFPTREDAITEVKASYGPSQIFFTGVKADPLSYHDFKFAQIIIEDIYCQLGEYVNTDYMDDWLNGSDLEEELDKQVGPIIKALIEKLDPPTFWGIEKVVQHET